MNNVIKKLEQFLLGTSIKIYRDEDNTFTFRVNSELFVGQVIKPSKDCIKLVHDLCEKYNQGNYVRFNRACTCFWFESFRK